MRIHLFIAALSLLLALSACSRDNGPKSNYEIQSERMMRSEALYLALNAEGALKPLGRDAENLKFPGDSGRALFEDQVLVKGLVESLPEPTRELHEKTITIRDWKLEDAERIVPIGELSLYGSLFEQVEYFKKAAFKLHIPVPKWRDPATMRLWEATLAIDAKVRLKNGRWGKVDGKARVLFAMQPESYEEKDPVKQVWKIREWKISSLKLMETDEWMFEEVLAAALPDAATLERAQFNIHWDNVRKYLNEEFKPTFKTWMIASGDRHPTVAVVDLDRDGFDDVYLQEREGKNMFFHNQGDGTFVDIAPQLGLDFNGGTAATTFADFDNDGDYDAFVGGLDQPSRLLENVGGKFADRSGVNIAKTDLPLAVSMLNSVDYDGDGLLDIYVCTYAGFGVQRAIRRIGGDTSEGKEDAVEDLQRYMQPWEFEMLLPELNAMLGTDTRFMDRPGPPNVMLRNVGGGRFERAKDCLNLRLLRNSYAAGWCDYDNDGDPDVYVANDFAPNYLMRNEGNGTFTDMSEKLQTSDVGFGMGVTWADYDHDGRQDLYITNMFSKANRRVVDFFLKDGTNFDAALIGDQPLEPVYAALGAGNSLFRNVSDDQPWDKVSGMEKPKLLVEAGGWGWGAMFVDFDNDSWDDLYGPAGYYTAPKEQEIAVDL
jgi:hypothetical protein